MQRAASFASGSEAVGLLGRGMGSSKSFGREGREIESFPCLVLETRWPVDRDVTTFRGLPADAGSDAGVAFIHGFHPDLVLMHTHQLHGVESLGLKGEVEQGTAESNDEHHESDPHRTAHFLLLALAFLAHSVTPG